MPKPAKRLSPVILGVATLDAIHLQQRVEPGFGGVAKNVACALGRLGQDPVFVSPGHGAAFDAALARHLQAHRVRWRRLPLTVPLPFFEAFVRAGGEVWRERYYDNDAFAPLNATLLLRCRDQLLADGSLLITSTDLHIRSLKTLETLCRQHQTPFYLISSSRAKAHRLRTLRPDLLALNLAELHRLQPPASDLPTLARQAAELVAPAGACLLTLGPAGALLVLPAAAKALHQPVPPLTPVSTVGAGDTLFAALIHHLDPHRPDWPLALTEATRHTLAYLSGGAFPQPLPSQQEIRI
ncbi:MAG: PfkB family carbohydrate kinase [Candidatus Sericytochromatia bacterium]